MADRGEDCWRFVIQVGLKSRDEHRRWSNEELEQAREELAKHSVEEVAKKLHRSPRALRAALHRNQLTVREIRCDCFSVEALARVLHVRKTEILAWIDKGWLQASARTHGSRHFYVITPEAFATLYKKHLQDLLAQKRIPSLSLFEAFYQYCYSPKHTLGEQLLVVRRDKREEAAYAAAVNGDAAEDKEDDSEDEDDGDADEEDAAIFSR